MSESKFGDIIGKILGKRAEEKDIVDVDLVDECDLALIDLPDPLVSISVVKKALKQSGFVVFYTPHINQAQAIVNALDEDFKYVTEGERKAILGLGIPDLFSWGLPGHQWDL